MMKAIIPALLSAVASAQLVTLPETLISVNTNDSNTYYGQLDTLLSAATAADLVSVLGNLTAGTLFAPTDDAFAKLGVDETTVVEIDPVVLANLLTYHLVGETLSASDVTSTTSLSTVYGASISVDGTVLHDEKGNTANILETDIQASNGVIHIIDNVLQPYDLAWYLSNLGEDYSTFFAALSYSSFGNTAAFPQGPYTVFAPSNIAWEALGYNDTSIYDLDPAIITNIIFNHVGKGYYTSTDLSSLSEVSTLLYTNVSVNGTSLTDAYGLSSDVISSNTSVNGVVHTIDGVLLPADLATTAVNLNTAGPYAGLFDTFLAAVTSANLTDAIKFPLGPYTVFAPTDDAFESAGVNSTTLSTITTEDLTTLLQGHIVEGSIEPDQLAGNTLPNAFGLADLVASNDGLGVYDASGALVNITAYTGASNGFIYAIDAVLQQS